MPNLEVQHFLHWLTREHSPLREYADLGRWLVDAQEHGLAGRRHKSDKCLEGALWSLNSLRDWIEKELARD